MAQKKVWIGPFGPLLYDDGTDAGGLDREGLRVEGGIILNTSSLSGRDKIHFYNEGLDEIVAEIFGNIAAGNNFNLHIQQPAGASPTFFGFLISAKVFSMGGMTTTERDNISSPTFGMTIYNTDNERYEYYTSTGWRYIQNSPV